VLETAQLLSTAHNILDGTTDLYKTTHKNHPCAIWVRQSKENYDWTYRLFVELCKEYTYRYGKEHLTYTKLNDKLKLTPRNISCIGFTSPAQAMPEEYKNSDPVVAYRNYYKFGKAHLADWTKRGKPDWFCVFPNE